MAAHGATLIIHALATASGVQLTQHEKILQGEAPVSTIIVVESRPLLLRGILQLISEMAPGCSAHGAMHTDIRLNRTQIQPHRYELMLLSLPSLDDVYEAVAIARSAYMPKAILLLSDGSRMAPWPRGVPPGVVGCVPIHGPSEMLQLSIRLVLAGRMVFPMPGSDHQPIYPGNLATGLFPDKEADNSPIAGAPPAQQHENEVLGLTRRQYEVLVLLARGYTLKAIARDLNIAVATAKVHAETVYQRLQVHNRNEAVYAAISRGATLGWPAMAREVAKVA